LGWGGGFYDRTLAALRATGPVLAVGVAYHGFYNREADLGRRNMLDLMARYEDGALKPHHSMIVPMKEAVGALTAIAERRSTGKVVLVND
jgi:NADPH:quinone reductase-like Zn-dependent oxidoreductase